MAKIRVTNVRYDGQAKGLKAPSTDGGVLGDYMVRCYSERDEVSYAGALTSPTGFDGTDVAVVRLGKPVTVWLVEWTGCKAGGVPPVPSPEPPAGWRRLDAHVTTAKIVVCPDGDTPVYRISGVYAFVKLKSGAGVFDDVVFPLAPWVRDVFSRSIGSDRITASILTPSGGGKATLGNPVSSTADTSKFQNQG